jgi:hypothetical protein
VRSYIHMAKDHGHIYSYTDSIKPRLQHGCTAYCSSDIVIKI